MQQLVAVAPSVDLCVETFGDPADPAVLLIGGAASSMDWWEDPFCERLAAGGRFVLRYDLRDTGRSTSYPAGSPAYGGPDLVTDALALLDAFELDAAHLVGLSMGGGIAQLIAIEHPERVASLTLMSTSPGGPDLPPMSPTLRAVFADPAPQPDWTDRAAVVDYVVAGVRPFAGSYPFDEAHVRELVGRIVDRTRDMAASATNHWMLDGGEPIRPRLGEITAPTLVLHGTADPLFPYGHAETLAAEIENAALMPLDGVGHEFPPPPVWDLVLDAILRHTSASWFEGLYRAGDAGAVPMPWSRSEPHPVLLGWATERDLAGQGRRAVVVGCGLGADAEYLAGLGFATTAFDISATAVRVAHARHPDSTVDYTEADLLDLPAGWAGSFDFVVEIITVQAIPAPTRVAAIGNVGRLVAPGGTLAVALRDSTGAPVQGPPWPLHRAEVEAFGADGLTAVRIEEIEPAAGQRWLAEFRRT